MKSAVEKADGPPYHAGGVTSMLLRIPMNKQRQQICYSKHDIYMLSEWNCKTQQNVLIDVKCNRYITMKITLSLHILREDIDIVNYTAVFDQDLKQQ